MNKCMKVVHWSDVINKNTIKYTFNRKQTYRFILKNVNEILHIYLNICKTPILLNLL